MFVKTVCRYGRGSRSKNKHMLKKMICDYKNHELSEANIEWYCELFGHLEKYHFVAPISLYQSTIPMDTE